MDYVAWCDRVLDAISQESEHSTNARVYGLDHDKLFAALFGEEVTSAPGFRGSDCHLAIIDALNSLESINVLVGDAQMAKINPTMRIFVEDLSPIWRDICIQPLSDEHIRVLDLVNRLSPSAGPEAIRLKEFDLLEHAESIGLTRELAHAVAHELSDFGLITVQYGAFHHYIVLANYYGLVWQTRRGFTLESERINALIAEGETTSVDFKRELSIDTADQKAEFVKDLIGLANTQASGSRYLIIGIDSKNSRYYGPPDKRLKLDRFEQIIADYIAPYLDIRFKVIEYRAGTIGQIEVMRERHKLPYVVAKSIGDKKRIKAEQIFVRHGSQTEEPTPAELEAIRQEGARARESI